MLTIKRLSRRKKRAFNQFRQTRSPDIWQYYKNLKELTQQECRQAYNDYILKLITPTPRSTIKNCGHISKARESTMLAYHHYFMMGQL